MLTEIRPSLNLILDGAYDGQFNMAFDERLFREQIRKKESRPILRFYRFKEPTLTIGYGMWRAANHSIGREIPVVRRITGGGIVFHTPEDLTYSLVAPISSHPSFAKTRESYLLIHDVLKKTFAFFNIKTELYNGCHSVPKGTVLTSDEKLMRVRADSSKKISYCFDSPVLYDVMLDGKKIAGAGQKRSFGYLLHQGSIARKEILHQRPDFNEKEFCETFARHCERTIVGANPRVRPVGGQTHGSAPTINNIVARN